MKLSSLLFLAAPGLATAQITDLGGALQSFGNALTSEFGQGFAQVTSFGGSIYTVVTGAVPSGASSLGYQITSIGGSLYTVVTSNAGVAASNIDSIGTQITSIGGSVYTLVTGNANPSALSSYGAQLTSLGGSLATILTSNVRLVGTKTTTANGSTYTVATNAIGQVVSTITPTASTGTTGNDAMITKAPVLAGGVLGAGLAAMALL